MDLSAAPARPAAAIAPQKRKFPAWLPIAAIIGVVALLAVICGSLFFTTSADVKVTIAGLEWERTVAVEELQTITEEGWELPAGARRISQREEIRSYTQVIDHR